MRVIAMSSAIAEIPKEMHIVPIGEWKEREFRITKEDCADILRNFEAGGIDLVIDYEHQSLNSQWNGQPAPAAGWIKKLEIRENGVWATELEFTEDARKMLEAREYRYISPVIIFNDRDPHTDEWVGCSVWSVALTNTPYFRDDLEPLINKRNPNEKTAKEPKMTELEQAQAAEIQTLKSKVDELTQANATKDAQLAEQAMTKKVEDAIAAKKLLPSMKDVAMIVAKSGDEALDKFIAANSAVQIPTDTKNIPEGTGGQGMKYEDLLNDAVKMEAFKKDHPAEFEQLRKAFYGGK